MNIFCKTLLLVIIGFLSFSKISSAHAPNQSYIFLYVYQDSIGGYYEITIDDLNKVMSIEIQDTSMADLKPYLPAIEKYVLEHLSFSSKLGNHPVDFGHVELLPAGAIGTYIKYRFKLGNVPSIPDAINIEYDALLDADPEHRGIQVVAYNWKAGILDNEAMISLKFDPDNRDQELDLTDASVWKGFKMMVESGMHHIWIGLDHILFIIALILPAVVFRSRREEEIEGKKGLAALSPMTFSEAKGFWKPVEKFKPAFIYIITIITFFTIAHSITLSLAAMNIVSLSSRFVESIIALSIALAAYNNIRPIFKKEWVLAFGFGLFHGFGFASVLGEVGLAGEFMTYSLLGFNIGVEIGQLAIILIAFPVLYLLRQWKYYPQLLVYGSIVLILISLYWFIERAFDIDILFGKLLHQLTGIAVSI